MSLKVWLPLDGNLENKGCSNITVTNNGATVNTSGKIGSCYYFDGSSTNYMTTTYSTAIGTNDFSIAMWIKIPTLTSGSYYAICTSKGAAAANAGFGIYWNYTQKKFLWSTADGSAATEIWMANTVDTIVYDKWIHLVMVRDNNDSKKGCFYINGTRYDLASVPAIRNITTDTKMYIGRCTTNNYLAKMYLNDFRIYDHALSAAEVHEISQGLVLHYKLDGYNLFNYDTLTHDIYVLSNGNTSTSGAVGNWCLTDYIPVFPSTSYIGYNLVNGGNGNPSICFYDENKTYTRGQAITANTPLSITTTDTEHYVRISVRKANNDINKMQFLEIPTIIQDSSGYGHNGSITGNIQLASDSGRYSNCIYIPSGNTDYITTNDVVGNFSSGITMNIWFKSSCTTPGNDYHEIFNIATATQNFETAIYKTGYFRGGMLINGIRYVANTDNNNLVNGQWHMITMTYDGTALKRYVDGILKSTSTIAGTVTSTSCKFLWGHYGTNTSYYAKEAYLSDTRIYVTALSADDIKSLYEVGGKIDNKQNLHIYEAIEMQSTIKLTKQGQMKAGEFQEDTATKLYKTDQIIETNNLIEL